MNAAINQEGHDYDDRILQKVERQDGHDRIGPTNVGDGRIGQLADLEKSFHRNVVEHRIEGNVEKNVKAHAGDDLKDGADREADGHAFKITLLLVDQADRNEIDRT